MTDWNDMNTQRELLEKIATCIIIGDNKTALICLLEEIVNLRAELEMMES
jgi:hypothetical protein